MITRYLIGLVMVPLVCACASSDEQGGGEQKEYITDAAPAVDSAAVTGISDELRTELADFFSAPVIAEIDQFLLQYNGMKTDADFEAVYQLGKDLMLSMDADLAEPQTDYLMQLSAEYEYWSAIEVLDQLQDFNGQLGPVEISCAAECTAMDFLFDLQAMLTKAKQTSGSADDDFLELVIGIEGDYGYAGYPGFKTWFNQTWDYGGSSLIGDESLLKSINQYLDYKKKYTLFSAELELIYTDFVDALVYGNTYHYSQEVILKEYDKILKIKDFLKPADEQKVREHYKAIQTGGDPFQFDCEHNDCSFG